ncbi:nucleotidyltransferase family protein [Tatumella sp. UBA2305]|uniref:nucleotidyltransferase family protein n=1 Tax=Tatumella sp. UBA2305 TaxID=1947647 RepID=UPI0025FE9286|nr:NTP transferase domain-containing protein [Tatumella sp. UBA2305]
MMEFIVFRGYSAMYSATDHGYGILILAAGKGRRFHQAGGQGDKLLAEYPDAGQQPTPLLALTLQQAIVSGFPVRIITRPQQTAVQQLAARFNLPVSLADSQGSGETIACGVRATPDWKGWLIVPGDMGWIVSDDYHHVAAALAAGATQVRPFWQQHPGHPVGFTAIYRDALMALSGDQGARQLLNPAILCRLPGHPGTVRDADLPR